LAELGRRLPLVRDRDAKDFAGYDRLSRESIKVVDAQFALIKGAESGNIATQECRDVFQDRLARASLAAVINILDPDVIVLGGGLSCSS
jgi:predicted NBD/HSP70 family sugar kinase